MQLPKEAVEEFKNIYKKEFGIMLPDEEAGKQAAYFLDFMSLDKTSRQKDNEEF